MSLFDHARAARILGERMAAGATASNLQARERSVMLALADAYMAGAARMEQEARDGIRAIAGSNLHQQ